MNDNDLLPRSRRAFQRDSDPEARAATPSVLMVCTGNICRSPLAEVLLRTRVSDLDVRVHSAGTHAMIGEGMPRPARKLALAHGAAPEHVDTHRARWLVDPMLDDATLVLGMSRRHRTEAVELAPHLTNQSFTALEFARLAQNVSNAQLRAAADAARGAPRERLAAACALIAAQRAIVGPAQGAHNDIVDPYKKRMRAYSEAAAQLVPVVDAVARVLRAALV